MPAHKSKKKKVKFRRFEFKLSDKQRKIIDRFCHAKKTSPNKMIKTAIREYISRYADTLPEDFISENQLSLFDVDDDSSDSGQLEKTEKEYTGLLF